MRKEDIVIELSLAIFTMSNSNIYQMHGRARRDDRMSDRRAA